MRKLLKFLKNAIGSAVDSAPDVVAVDDATEILRGHLCQRKEWKEGTAVTCDVCSGDGMDFMFADREQFERTQELKEKQLNRKIP